MNSRKRSSRKKDLERGRQPKDKQSGEVRGLVAMVLVFLGGLGGLLFRRRKRRDPGKPVPARDPDPTRQEGIKAAEASYFNRLTLRLAGSGLFYALALVAGVAVLLVVYFLTIGMPPEAMMPPLPRQLILEVRPRVAALEEERFNLLDEQIRRLNSYGWIDQGAGRVHIPIERAILILAEDGDPHP
jgi:hypothetical protein